MAIKNLVVFGYGFVGSTVADFLKAETEHNVVIIDPKYDHFNNDPLQAVMEADGVIICVPTPSRSFGDCDDRAIKNILELCDYRHNILIKSTVPYDLLDKYDVNVVYSPEFLKQNNARDDFYAQDKMIFGYADFNESGCDWWIDVFKDGLPDVDYIKTDRATASMVKYVHNSWLATKVAFFHELFKVGPDHIDYNNLTDILAKFPNIGPSHMKAPNDVGGLGYDGACFPKDVLALLHIMPHTILKQVHDTNTKLKEGS